MPLHSITNGSKDENKYRKWEHQLLPPLQGFEYIKRFCYEDIKIVAYSYNLGPFSQISDS